MRFWSCPCAFHAILLLPSTTKRACWNSKCRCHQQKKPKTPACIRETQVHKLCTKVYSQKGLTAMEAGEHASTGTSHSHQERSVSVQLLCVQVGEPQLTFWLLRKTLCVNCYVQWGSTQVNNNNTPKVLILIILKSPKRFFLQGTWWEVGNGLRYITYTVQKSNKANKSQTYIYIKSPPPPSIYQIKLWSWTKQVEEMFSEQTWK